MGAKLASGGGGGKRSAMQPNSEPNVIPFIDVMLVLLIIFMVAAPMPTVDIRVDLPSSRSTLVREQGRLPTMVRIEDEAGVLTYWVDGRQTTEAELGNFVLQRAIENNPALPIESIYAEAVIVFGADQETAYANVVGTMGRLQEEGFAKVSLFSELAQL